MKKLLLWLPLFLLACETTKKPEPSNNAGDKMLAAGFSEISALILKNCPKDFKLKAGLEADYADARQHYRDMHQLAGQKIEPNNKKFTKADCNKVKENISVTYFLENK